MLPKPNPITTKNHLPIYLLLMESLIYPYYISIGARQEARPQEIILFEADINYTKVHFANGKLLMVATTLKAFEDRFKSHNFFRTHKGFLVNMGYVDHICEIESKLYMKNHQEVIVSRRRMVNVKNELQKQVYQM
jgi:DNA-binding LytR/AlgR family response regulator